MKQPVGFFFYFPDAVRRFYDKQVSRFLPLPGLGRLSFSPIPYCREPARAAGRPASPRRRSRKFLYIRTYPPDCPFLPAASGTIILIEYYV